MMSNSRSGEETFVAKIAFLSFLEVLGIKKILFGYVVGKSRRHIYQQRVES